MQVRFLSGAYYVVYWECIYLMKDNSKSLLERVWIIVKKNILVSATLVFVVILLIVSIALVGITRIREKKAAQRAYEALSEEEKALLNQDFTVVKDGYDFINRAMTDYLNALADNNQAYLKENMFSINNNELDNVEVKSKYIDHYDNIVCYTQQGYEDESFYVYVTYDIYFKDINTPVPGIIGLYYAKDSLEKYASGWIGAKYVYGAASKSKTDCSGFVMQVYKGYFNIALDHNAASMYKDSRGSSVSRGSLREGDLVFFGSFWKIDHVGIYLSGDRFIHASSSKGVMISPMNDKYWSHKYQGGRRFR